MVETFVRSNLLYGQFAFSLTVSDAIAAYFGTTLDYVALYFDCLFALGIPIHVAFIASVVHEQST